MTDAVTTFNLQLQAYAMEVHDRLAALNTKAGTGLTHARNELRQQVAALEARSAQAKASVEASAAIVAKWAGDSVATVEAWKDKLDIGMLTARAGRADDYAKAASEVAMASVTLAEKAALDARGAHADVVAAKGTKAI